MFTSVLEECSLLRLQIQFKRQEAQGYFSARADQLPRVRRELMPGTLKFLLQFLWFIIIKIKKLIALVCNNI